MTRFSRQTTFGMIFLAALSGAVFAQESLPANNRGTDSTLPDLALQPPRVFADFGRR